MKINLILASSSKYRQNLFKKIGWKYNVIKSMKEESSDATNPEQYVIELSKDKAESVSDQINEKAIIVAADEILYMNGKIFEKPNNKAEAIENLKLMSGNVVNAVTGVTIKDLYNNKEISFSDITKIHLKSLSTEDINWYIENEKDILNCCGFVIEGKGATFIDKIEGDYNTTIGISVSKLYDKFKELGYKPSDFELIN